MITDLNLYKYIQDQYSGGRLFDPRGGTATYDVYVTPVQPPPAIEFGTILYTDESSSWQGNTLVGTTVSIDEYDWGTQVITSPLDQISFNMITERGYSSDSEYNSI